MTQLEFCNSFQEGRVPGAGPGKEGGSEGPPGTDPGERVSEGLGLQGAWGRRSLGLANPLPNSPQDCHPSPQQMGYSQVSSKLRAGIGKRLAPVKTQQKPATHQEHYGTANLGQEWPPPWVPTSTGCMCQSLTLLHWHPGPCQRQKAQQ